MESNYEKQVYTARKLFLQYDSAKMAERFGLLQDAEYLYLPLLDEAYRISKTTGEIGRQEADGSYAPCMDYNVVMTICDVLCCSKERPALLGEWCPLYALQVTMSSPSPELSTAGCARLFAGKAGALQRICETIGGTRPEISAGADVCWQFAVFPFFPVQLRFWDLDEEFDAKIQLLWDRNALDFMHFETLYYVMGHLMKRLEEGLGE